MHVRLLAIGTRRDVQPYIALGLGLKRAGFGVSIAATADFRPFVESYGIECLTTDLDLRRAVADPQEGARAAKWAVFRTLLSETERLCRDADCVICSPTTTLTAPHVAEKLGIPALPALLQPYLDPTGRFPAVMLPSLPVGGRIGERYNLLTYRAFEGLTRAFVGRQINHWREKRLGLPPSPINSFALIRQRSTPTLYGISPSVLPKPREWGEHVHLTGYWFLPRGQEPSEELARFLDAGKPPVFVGFGSTASKHPRATAMTVLEAVRQAGVRAVLSSGWGGLSASEVPEDVLLVREAPHDWVLPRVASVVHHGGAGTTAEGLRAGRPTVVVPAGGDQPFWGRRMERLGVGPAPIPRRRLTAERLARAIRESLGDRRMRGRATTLGERIRAEDGVERAVELIGEAIDGR
ncbi:MAG TPA: glycosyltransferase [Rubrobacter sp.]|jgi:sterol 3beta-glucosyltransferase|nr:glycosyltransferase [Rubrobacter sp.]